MSIWARITDAATRLAQGESLASLLGLGAAPGEDGSHPGTRQIAFTIGVIALGAKMAKVDRKSTRLNSVTLESRMPSSA